MVGVFDIIRAENLEEFSWLRKEHHEHFDRCGLVAQRESDETSRCERDWTCTTMCGEREQWFQTSIKLNATPSYLKPDGNDVEVREMDSDARMQRRASRHMQTNTWSDVKHIDTSSIV